MRSVLLRIRFAAFPSVPIWNGGRAVAAGKDDPRAERGGQMVEAAGIRPPSVGRRDPP